MGGAADIGVNQSVQMSVMESVHTDPAAKSEVSKRIMKDKFKIAVF